MFMVTRSLRGDIFEIFRIVNDFDNIDQEHFFVYSRSTLMGHNKKLFKPRLDFENSLNHPFLFTKDNKFHTR